METSTFAWVCGLVLVAAPLLWQLIWRWNDLVFVRPLQLKGSLINLPPGHMGLPLIGETLTFLWYFKILRRPDDFINSKKERYGDGVGMYRTHLFGSPSIITCSSDSNKFILQSADDFHISWPEPELVGKTSVVNVEGKQHTILRSFVVNSINQPDALTRITNVVQPRIVSALQTWANKGIIKASVDAKKLTFENICMLFVSMKPGPLLDTVDNYFQGVIPGLRAFPFDFPGTAFHHALQCRRKLTAVFQAELDKRRKQRQSGSVEAKDLMDGLMQVKSEDGKQLSDAQVVDNIVSFVIGGYESTSVSIMWALYHLAKSPEALQKLREENAAISKGKKGEFITFEDISQLKYTAKVVEETIRMANISSIIFRSAKRDVEYRGYRIPKDWQVLVWIRSIHTDPKNFEDPLSFKPERWNQPPKPGTFQVFGGGARICAGNMLVRIQLAIILHHLSLGYKWKLVNNDAKMNYLPHPTPADGVVLEFHAL